MALDNHDPYRPGSNSSNNDDVKHDAIIDGNVTPSIDITELIFDFATNHLNVREPFISNNHSLNNSTIESRNGRLYEQSMSTSITPNPNLNLQIHKQNEDTDDVFNLQDAMAATQLLDPKMDGCQIPISGYHCYSRTTDTAATIINPNNENNTSNERMVYPRPIPIGLDNDPNHSLLWDDLTIVDATIICIETLVRFQSFLSGSAVSESTFTCLYAHASVLSDMQSRLYPNRPNHNSSKSNTDRNAAQSATTILEELMQQVTLDDPSSKVITTKNISHTNTSTSDTDNTEESPLLLALQWSVFACTYSMVDLTEMIRDIIFNADIYEEEDFVVPTHNIPFYPSLIVSQQEGVMTTDDNSDIDTMDSILFLKTAIQFINDLSTTTQLGEDHDNNENDSMYYLQIIGDVLRYEFHMIQILPILSRLHSGPDLHDTLVSIQTILQTAMQRLNQIHTNITKFILVDDKNNFEERINNDTDKNLYCRPSTQRTIQRSFDAYVIRPYVGNIPLRKIKYVSPPQSIHILRTVTTELDTYVCSMLLRCNVQSHHGNTTTLNRIYRILDHIHDTNILCRSILLLNLYFDDKIFGQYDLRDLISLSVQGQQHSNITTTTVDDNVLSHENDKMMLIHQEFTDDTLVFLNRLAKPIYDSMKVRFFHRHRQRAYIEIVILPEWISLYKEAKIFDLHYTHHRQQQQKQRLHAGRSINTANDISELEKTSYSYFTQYILTAQIQFMDRYLETGMEVGLFRNIIHDITFAYWYRDYLLSTLHIQLSAKVDETSQQVPTPVATTNIPTMNVSPSNKAHKESKLSSKTGNKKKNHHHNNKNGKHLADDNHVAALSPPSPTNNQILRTIMPNEYEDMYELKVVSLKRHLCRKTIQYVSLLRKVGIIKEQTFEFTSLKHIFMKRFDIFHSVHQPPPLFFEDYMDGIDASSISTTNLIQVVSEGYKACRTMIDEMISTIIDHDIDAMHITMSMPELRSLMKVCVGNIVYVQRLRQLLEKQNGSASSVIVTAINAKATFDFDSHNQFCIIKIEEVIE